MMLPKIDKNLVIGILATVILVFSLVIGWVILQKGVAPLEEEMVPGEQEEILEQMKTGEVGEIEEGKTLEQVNPEAVTNPVRPPGTSMPPVVSDTKGEIVATENDGIKVLGSGENFEDQKARILFVKFTSQTITFEKGQKIKYTGLAGLAHLKPGEKILISSSENIRGKTEFQANYINKI